MGDKDVDEEIEGTKESNVKKNIAETKDPPADRITNTITEITDQSEKDPPADQITTIITNDKSVTDKKVTLNKKKKICSPKMINGFAPGCSFTQQGCRDCKCKWMATAACSPAQINLAKVPRTNKESKAISRE